MWPINGDLKDIANQIDKIDKRAADALMLAQEFAKGTTQELSKLSSALERLKTSPSPSLEQEQRLAKLEAWVGEIRALMLEKTPNGKTKLSRTGRQIATGQALNRG